MPSKIELPAAPGSIAETGLDLGFLADLILKTLYFAGNVNGGEITDRIAMPLHVTGDVLTFLRRQYLIEVTGGSGISPATLFYSLTNAGLERATGALAMSGYIGPAPVPLAAYFEAVARQSVYDMELPRKRIEESVSHLVLRQETVDLIGQALSAKRSFLLYGESGNGKTSAAEGLRNALTGTVLVPYAVEVMHQVIQVYDPSAHEPAGGVPIAEGKMADRRWLAIKRPAVFAAGELAPTHLELVRDDVHKTYEAPIQMKANGGMLVIDDFGRQHLDAAYLLNRWIVPLEKGVDYLSLHNGARFQTPFDVIPVFITNRRPADLADDAFLRRIRYKIEVPGPDKELFLEILKRECGRNGVMYEEGAAAYLVDKYFIEPGRGMRGCHPRDIVEAIAASTSYRGEKPALNQDTIDQACASYFL